MASSSSPSTETATANFGTGSGDEKVTQVHLAAPAAGRELAEASDHDSNASLHSFATAASHAARQRAAGAPAPAAVVMPYPVATSAADVPVDGHNPAGELLADGDPRHKPSSRASSSRVQAAIARPRVRSASSRNHSPRSPGSSGHGSSTRPAATRGRVTPCDPLFTPSVGGDISASDSPMKAVRDLSALYEGEPEVSMPKRSSTPRLRSIGSTEVPRGTFTPAGGSATAGGSSGGEPATAGGPAVTSASLRKEIEKLRTEIETDKKKAEDQS